MPKYLPKLAAFHLISTSGEQATACGLGLAVDFVLFRGPTSFLIAPAPRGALASVENEITVEKLDEKAETNRKIDLVDSELL